ncbi:MAG: hypothetical protein ACREQW_24210, partial [Candidatus Binatia bacterium]
CEEFKDIFTGACAGAAVPGGSLRLAMCAPGTSDAKNFAALLRNSPSIVISHMQILGSGLSGK